MIRDSVTGARLMVTPVTLAQYEFLTQLELGGSASLKGLQDPATFTRRLGPIIANRIRFRVRAVEALVAARAIYREVAWSPIDREYDITYRLTAGVNKDYAVGYISIPFIAAAMLQ